MQSATIVSGRASAWLNRHEHFILRNRRILADQMEYLLAGVPRSSRLRLVTGHA